jgi:Uncharacterized protein conserved in bacteria
MNLYKKFPILCNLILVVIASLLVVWIVLKWLDSYTRHDKTVVIPVDVINMTVSDAEKLLAQKKLSYEIIDSIYVKQAVPGTIYKVSPPEGNNVKEGRKIYLTLYAQNPPQISVPEVRDISQRQALAQLKSVGFESITVQKVDGPYRDLVVGLESNGQPIAAGVRCGYNTPLTLLVSSGSTFSELPIDSGEASPIIDDTPPDDESWF